MKQLGKRFLEEYVPNHCKPSTAYEYGRSVKFFINPRIGARKVKDIKRSDIAELHHALRETPYQANRTLGVLSKMFSLAEIWGFRADGSNPCLHVKRYKEEKRERFLSAEEFACLGRVLDEILRDGSEIRRQHQRLYVLRTSARRGRGRSDRPGNPCLPVHRARGPRLPLGTAVP